MHFPEKIEVIWHEIFQILPIGLKISMPFHLSFSPLSHLKEKTTFPLQGFLLCSFFCWKEHKFWSLFWVQILTLSLVIAMYPWENYLTSLSLSFLIYKVGTILLTA